MWNSIQLTPNIKYEFMEPTDDPYGYLRRARTTPADFTMEDTPKSQRPVAGNKRVAKLRAHQEEHSGSVQVLQSITAPPELRHSSFEELRLECYLQSAEVKGGPPLPVDAVESPSAIIPPVFNAFKDDDYDDNADLFLSEVVMEG